MAHIQHLARKRPTVRFFGTECQIVDMAHDAIEIKRCEDENAILRAEIADLKRSLSESIQGQHATALRLAELMEREQALVAAIERAEYAHRYTLETLRMAESAHRYTLETLRMAQNHINYMQGVITAHGDEAQSRLDEVEDRSTRSIAALAEVDSE